jgi:Brp/Blh family beta-carotene 15,15'-monooxygenase
MAWLKVLQRRAPMGSSPFILGPCLFAALWLLAAWSEQRWPAAGLWVMLGLSLSTGLLHGALDALLLLQNFASRTRALGMAGLYLAAVLAAGALLSRSPTLALFALIAMSAWHFGEPFGRWAGPTRTPPQVQIQIQTPALAGLTRAVLGTAPVLLLPWTQASAATSTLLPWLPAEALQAWRDLGVVWLGLFAAWAWVGGLPRWRVYRQAWAELLAVLLLNLTLSPLLAFALYFGAYHAPLHIWRVWRAVRIGNSGNSGKAMPLPRTATAAAAITVVLLLTAGLGALLWQLPGADRLQTAVAGDALRWLVVALAALTLPHLLLISRCSRWLESALQK